MKTPRSSSYHLSDPKPVRALDRRDFLRLALGFTAGCACCGHPCGLVAGPSTAAPSIIISPGCRRSKVKIAKVYLGIPKAHWPTPKLQLEQERERYEAVFARKDFADIEFLGNQLATTKEEISAVGTKLSEADGILLIHLSMGVEPLVRVALEARKPTILFAAPYSGHEWTRFGGLRREAGGEHLECMLTSDLNELSHAVRPFRAIHHLREARLLNITARALPANYTKAVADKFGTEIKVVDLKRTLAAYDSVDLKSAEQEMKRLIRGATKVVEPQRDEILRSCRLALAFEKLMAEEDATALTVDCYGSMYRQLPAFPCVGLVRLNDMGLAGICESDLTSAMTFLLMQTLSGRPGFVSDPTIDESKHAIILAHCLGSTRMDGPDGPRAPYKLRTIMERQEGCVPQVRMRVGQKVTQAVLVGMDKLQFFTGDVIEVPDIDRGCRTKITVKVDGDIQKLWQNWSHGLHRVTCYGDLVPDLGRFCRFKSIELFNEA